LVTLGFDESTLQLMDLAIHLEQRGSTIFLITTHYTKISSRRKLKSAEVCFWRMEFFQGIGASVHLVYSEKFPQIQNGGG
jgi:hypothetical protein